MTFVKDLTGPGKTDGPLAMYGADLGIMRRDPLRGNLPVACFGDNFELPNLKGEWRSPSFVMYNEHMDPLGPPLLDHLGKPAIDAASRVRQAWPYKHANPEFSTILPTDYIYINGLWWLHCFATRGLGNEVWTEWRSSPDLVNWTLEHTQQPPFPEMIMLTFDKYPANDYVYIYGTGGLKRNKPIWLWRCDSAKFPLEAGWQGWTGTGWAGPGEVKPILTGTYGELSYRYIEGDPKRRAVLAYFDSANYRVAARTMVGAAAPGAEKVIATGTQFPQLYGGYVAPQSRLDELDGLQLVVSQWNTSTNDPYKASLHTGTLGKTARKAWWPWVLT